MNLVDKRLTELEKHINTLELMFLSYFKKQDFEHTKYTGKGIKFSAEKDAQAVVTPSGNIPKGTIVAMMHQEAKIDICKHYRTVYSTDGQLWCEDCYRLIDKPEAKPEPSEQTLEDGKKECGCFCCTQRRTNSTPDKVSISRKVVEEVMRANYVLPNDLHDELKRAMEEGV